MGFWFTAIWRALKGAVFYFLTLKSLVILLLIFIFSAIFTIARYGYDEFLTSKSKWFWANFLPCVAVGILMFIWYFLKMPSTIIEETKKHGLQRYETIKSMYDYDVSTLVAKVESLTLKKNDFNSQILMFLDKKPIDQKEGFTFSKNKSRTYVLSLKNKTGMDLTLSSINVPDKAGKMRCHIEWYKRAGSIDQSSEYQEIGDFGVSFYDTSGITHEKFCMTFKGHKEICEPFTMILE